ncbi:cobalamin B12-binding domain-containing protein [Thermoactinomyces sp. DSM 45892]|uniref:cobalamin B12-binding domain-containing protein n=1 Tax=Thermoactinomyces sp. DSM 45892 TaxID=1882753 RepID=UPI00089C65F3|nr:cobalamin B12-binding domain-containing protein [Thermoactinomyces sp. DSM 45892]SDX92035.1 methylmalonyl-CoA mutase, C-terminal domain [Thermoactinomyces sp. DSM 45892]
MLRPIRILIGKPGLDGHDRGALIIAQGLRDEGMEVIYTGLRQSPAQIVAMAIQEDVDLIGLSCLSGAHMELFPVVVTLLKKQKADDILVFGGGVIPQEDIPLLKKQGIREIFTPGTTIQQTAQFIRQLMKEEKGWGGSVTNSGGVQL